MRKFSVIAAVLLTSSGLVQAADGKQNMFTCLDAKSLSVDSQCASLLIANNQQFQTMQKNIDLSASFQNPNVQATVQFYPEKMLIKVSAQAEKTDQENLLVMLQ